MKVRVQIPQKDNDDFPRHVPRMFIGELRHYKKVGKTDCWVVRDTQTGTCVFLPREFIVTAGELEKPICRPTGLVGCIFPYRIREGIFNDLGEHVGGQMNPSVIVAQVDEKHLLLQLEGYDTSDWWSSFEVVDYTSWETYI